jgi:hypothetical protein
MNGQYQRRYCNSDVTPPAGVVLGYVIARKRGRFFHPIDYSVMDITAARAIARQASRQALCVVRLVHLSGPNAKACSRNADIEPTFPPGPKNTAAALI